MDTKFNRILLMLNIALALLLGVFLIINFSRNSNTSDVSVTGFGTEADTDVFPIVVEEFLDTSCDYVLSNDKIFEEFVPTLTSKNYDVTAYQIAPSTDLPLSCKFKLEDGSYMNFKVYTYNSKSVIDDTREDLWNRVNPFSIEDEIDSGRYGPIDYFFGTSVNYPDTCATTIYHPMNEIEVAIVEYFGVSNCYDLVEENQDFVKIFGSFIWEKLDKVYSTYNNKTTLDLIKEYGYTDYLEDNE